MRRFLLYLFIGILFAVLQSSAFPIFLTPNWRPNLLLILILFLGLSENLPRAIVAGLFLGAIQDSFCGTCFGLYVLVYLVIVLVTQLFSRQLNIESPLSFLLLIVGGTLAQNLLVGFLLTVFADTAPVLHILLPAIPQQLLANLIFAPVLLFLLLRFQRLLGYRAGPAGLVYQSKYHGA